MGFRFAASLVGCLLVIVTCDAPGDIPDNHTLSLGGIYHRPGLENPTLNCTACHGDDLGGGSSGVSCYTCHSKLP